MASRILSFLTGVTIAAALVSAVVPRGVVAASGWDAFTIRAMLFGLSAGLVLLGLCRSLARAERGPLTHVSPFLILFLFLTYRLTLRPETYNFGLDSGFYYSYLPSVIIDHDFDLSNQYRSCGFDRGPLKSVIREKTQTGHAPNVFPVGSALLWSPFFVAGHLVARGLTAFGSSLPLDGFAITHVRSVQVGQVLLSCVALALIYAFLLRWFTRFVSLLTVFSIWLATSFLGYADGVRLTSEMPSALAIAAIFLFLQRWEDRFDPGTGLALGVTCGLAIEIRLQNVVFFALPIVVVIAHLRRGRDESLGSTLVSWVRRLSPVLAGLIGASIPQLVVWEILYGTVLPSFGGLAPNLTSPHLIESLFSSRKGLFTWSPILVLSVCGVIGLIRARRSWGWACALILALGVFLNAAQPDFWAGNGYGTRRLIGCSALFAVGLAASLAFLLKRMRPKPIAISIALALCLCFAVMNLRLHRAFVAGTIDRYHAVRFADVYAGPYALFRYIPEALEMPAQLYYKAIFGTPMHHPESEWFIGDDIFYFQEKHGELLRGAEGLLFGGEWKREDTGEGRAALRQIGEVGVMNLPLFFLQKPGIIVQMEIENGSSVDSAFVDVSLNGRSLRSEPLDGRRSTVSVLIAPRDYSSGMNRLEMRVRGEASSRALNGSLKVTSLHFVRTREATAGRAWWLAGA